MLADERKDFQPVDQLFAVLVRFFALAVCSEQQILELVLDGVKGIVAFEKLLQLFWRFGLSKPDNGFGSPSQITVSLVQPSICEYRSKIISAESWSNAMAFTIIASQPMAITSVGVSAI